MADFTEHQLASESIFSGRLLDVRKDKVRLPDGREAAREYIVHPGAVMVLPLFDDGSILIERQYRYAMRRHFYELPAGKIEGGEDDLATAQRELLEETGYIAQSWRHLLTIHPCIAYSTERIELYLARELSFVGHTGEDGEFLETLQLPQTEAWEWLRNGKISDAKTIIALLWLKTAQ
ncbi:MAG: NUDIX hydrolase [Burkholderiales bacterium]|nr:NUDIX hydrolase [Burkholderiales bacterium]